MLIWKNNKGFSLVSVLVAIGLAGVLATLLMNLSEQQANQYKKAQVDADLIESFQKFTTNIHHYDSCFATFTGLTKGATLTEIRIDTDPNKDPYAEVGKKFRGSPLILKSLKVLTDLEVKNRDPSLLQAKDASGRTSIVLEVTLERPQNVKGNKFVTKVFEVPVAVGKAEIISMPSQSTVSSKCKELTGNNGCIANFKTSICGPESAWADEMRPAGDTWMGYCIDATPANAIDDIIFNCTTLK